MNNRTVFLLMLFILVAVLLPSVHAGDTGVVADQQSVTVTLTDRGLFVTEDIKVTNNALENTTLLRFWLQQNAQDLTVTAGASNVNLIPFTLTSGNVRTCNLSAVNLSILPAQSLSVHVTYDLDSSAQIFEQALLYDTTLYTVTYNGQTLYQGEHLIARTDGTSTLQVRLFKPTETPLSMTVIIILFVLVVAVLGILLFLLQRQRRGTKKTTLAESEETLTTKKTLLLSLLKDLEKQYRAKSISDETYNKLKDEYKQQAVDTMKRLDDMKK
ncbi:MAG TPA: hypothetical protein VMT57_04275 [Candidatus Thermoplasmatota archaeon]|nr:hypothetical protein [Candidatus Thermoplasmatota archaeon]